MELSSSTTRTVWTWVAMASGCQSRPSASGRRRPQVERRRIVGERLVRAVVDRHHAVRHALVTDAVHHHRAAADRGEVDAAPLDAHDVAAVEGAEGDEAADANRRRESRGEEPAG